MDVLSSALENLRADIAASAAERVRLLESVRGVGLACQSSEVRLAQEKADDCASARLSRECTAQLSANERDLMSNIISVAQSCDVIEQLSVQLRHLHHGIACSHCPALSLTPCQI